VSGRQTWLIVGGTLFAAALLYCWRSYRAWQVEPALGNPFTTEVVFRRADNGAAVPEVVEMSALTGFYADVSFAARDDRPATWEEREVRNPENWAMALVIYPRGSHSEADDAIRTGCDRYRSPTGLKTQAASMLEIGAQLPFWWNAGYTGEPEPPENAAQEDLRFWTYVAAPGEEAAEYVYELTLYPTFKAISDARVDAGPGVVLQRGLLKLAPATEAQRAASRQRREPRQEIIIEQ
jgi:hypothetical protein